MHRRRDGAAGAAALPRPRARRAAAPSTGSTTSPGSATARSSCCGVRRQRRDRRGDGADIEADRLRTSLRSAEQERSRWARELHDETLQGLAALGVLLAAGCGRAMRRSSDAVAQAARRSSTTEIANLRALITELRPGGARRARARRRARGARAARARGRGARGRAGARGGRGRLGPELRDGDLPAGPGVAHQRRPSTRPRDRVEIARAPATAAAVRSRRRRRPRLRRRAADAGFGWRDARAGGADRRAAGGRELAARDDRQRPLPWCSALRRARRSARGRLRVSELARGREVRREVAPDDLRRAATTASRPRDLVGRRPRPRRR